MLVLQAYSHESGPFSHTAYDATIRNQVSWITGLAGRVNSETMIPSMNCAQLRPSVNAALESVSLVHAHATAQASSRNLLKISYRHFIAKNHLMHPVFPSKSLKREQNVFEIYWYQVTNVCTCKGKCFLNIFLLKNKIYENCPIFSVVKHCTQNLPKMHLIGDCGNKIFSKFFSKV